MQIAPGRPRAPRRSGPVPRARERATKMVNVAFQIDGVLVDVDAAPEARRHMRIAHGMIDQQIRDVITDRRLAGWRKALERGGVHAVH